MKKEEIQLKELIPKNEEFISYRYEREVSISPARTTTIIYLESKPKEKSFEEYVEEYAGDSLNDIDYNIWEPEVKFGILWHIVKDKGGNLNDFADMVKLIREGVHTLSSVDTRCDMYNVLSPEFIESFKEE